MPCSRCGSFYHDHCSPLSPEQVALESWLNEDPEMRHVEVLVGDRLRICVRLFQVSFDEPHERKVAEFEAGTLLGAIEGAVKVAGGAQ